MQQGQGSVYTKCMLISVLWQSVLHLVLGMIIVGIDSVSAGAEYLLLSPLLLSCRLSCAQKFQRSFCS